MKNLVRRIVILLVLISGFLVATLAVTIFSVWAGEIPRITPKELKKMIENKADILVVDNQPKGAYDIGHILGAVNFPWATEIKMSANLPRDKVLVLYCACGHEEDAADLANQLIEKFDYENIKLLEGVGCSGSSWAIPSKKRSEERSQEG